MSSEMPVLGRVSSLGALTALRRATIDFDGPYRVENPATFRDYRFDVELRHSDTGEMLRAPGFFAADGRAGETGASSGGVWRVAFAPPREGVWRYRAHLRSGPDVALSAPQSDPRGLGEASTALDGAEGALDVGRQARPGETPEGSVDLGAAGALEMRGEMAAFPAIGFERPGLALSQWSALLGADAFDDPALSESGAPLLSAASVGAAPVAGAAPYAGAFRLVEKMAERAAADRAGLVRFDLFPAALGARAAGPWRRTAHRSREAIDPLCFDVSRIDQWEMLFARLSARGLAVELNLDPPTPEEAYAFWREPETQMARRLMLRELAARFSGLGAMLWRGSMAGEDLEFLAALDPSRAAAPSREFDEEMFRAEGGYRVAAGAARLAVGAATPAEPEAIATQPPPGGSSDHFDTVDDPKSAPPSDAISLLEGAGAATSTAMRRLGGLLQDAARASEAILTPPPSSGSGDRDDDRSGDAPSGAPGAREGGGQPAVGAAVDAAAPVVLADPGPAPLRVADLGGAWGSGEISMSLYRLEDSMASPEAEPLQAAPGVSAQGVEFAKLAADGASLIVRFAGPEAEKAKRARLWVRRLRSADDVVEPPAAEDDPCRVGPKPQIESAEPFALFTDLEELGRVSAEGPTQLVLEALGAGGEEGSSEPLKRWTTPLASAGIGGLEGALSALMVGKNAIEGDAAARTPNVAGEAAPLSDRMNSETALKSQEVSESNEASKLQEAPKAKEASPDAETLSDVLTDKILRAPQTQSPKAAGAGASGPVEAENSANNAAKTGAAQPSADPSASPDEKVSRPEDAPISKEALLLEKAREESGAAEAKDGGSVQGGETPGPEKGKRPGSGRGPSDDGRPVFFGALVSEARRKEAERRQAGSGARKTNFGGLSLRDALDARSGRNGAAQAEAPEAQEPVSQELVSQEAETQEPATQEPETQEPATQEWAAEKPPTREDVEIAEKEEIVPEEIVPNEAVAPREGSVELSLRRLELIDAETDRRIATLREGAHLDEDAVLGRRVTVKATLAGAGVAQVSRLRVTLSGDELAQRAVDRPQPSLDECVGMFYGLMFHHGRTELTIEAMQDEDPALPPLFSARRGFMVGE